MLVHARKVIGKYCSNSGYFHLEWQKATNKLQESQVFIKFCRVIVLFERGDFITGGHYGKGGVEFTYEVSKEKGAVGKHYDG